MQTNVANFSRPEARRKGDEAVVSLVGGDPPRRLRFIDRYSRFVGLAKTTLFVVALLLISVIVIWPQFRAFDSGFRIGFASVDPEEAAVLQMVNARYMSTDSKSRPYTVTAEVASQATSDEDLVELTAPKSDMTLENGTWIALASESGWFHKETKVLDLVGSVNLFHDSGYEFRTDQIRVNLLEGVAEGDSPVEGQGPFGVLNAEGVRIYDRGQRIVFTGRSKLVLHPQGGKSAR